MPDTQHITKACAPMVGANHFHDDPMVLMFMMLTMALRSIFYSRPIQNPSGSTSENPL